MHSILFTMLPFHVLVVSFVLAVLLLLKWPRLWNHLMALFLGILIGFINLHNDEIVFPALLLLAFGFFLGFGQPTKAWRWALILAIWVPVSEFYGIFAEGATDKLINQGFGSFMAFVPAFIGTYLGVIVHKASEQFQKPPN